MVVTDAAQRLDPIIGGMTPKRIFLALFAADVAQLGVTVRPSILDSGHTRCMLSNGDAVSLTRLLDLLRAWKLQLTPCAACGGTIHPTGYHRGRRLGSMYCSSACRQRAYRQRRKVSPTALSVTLGSDANGPICNDASPAIDREGRR
jgi:hypothetical protein